MLGCQMRFAKQDDDHRVRMPLPDLGNLVRGMLVASANLSQIFSRHAVEPVDSLSGLTRYLEQFVEWLPVVSPVQIETDALAQFRFFNLLIKPFVENMLVARENGL